MRDQTRIQSVLGSEKRYCAADSATAVRWSRQGREICHESLEFGVRRASEHLVGIGEGGEPPRSALEVGGGAVVGWAQGSDGEGVVDLVGNQQLLVGRRVGVVAEEGEIDGTGDSAAVIARDLEEACRLQKCVDGDVRRALDEPLWPDDRTGARKFENVDVVADDSGRVCRAQCRVAEAQLTCPGKSDDVEVMIVHSLQASPIRTG
ncbi:hypothetical protein GCM10020255_095750 [Rhodococcus baikonurensis]